VTTTELLTHLRKLNVTLSFENGQLIFNGPKGALTVPLRAELSERKAEILKFLKNAAAIGATPTESSLRCVSRDKDLPLSFAQQRLWFLDQLEPGGTVYNVPGAFRIKGPLDVAVLKNSLEEIVRRHEALRTTFSIVEGEPFQVITPSLSCSLPAVDISHLSESKREAEALRLAAEEANKPFDLRQGPLFRATLIRLDQDDHVLLLTLHHIVSDGWSTGVLYRELSALYQAFANGEPSPLADLPIQYANFAVWQREWLQGEVLESQLSYWRKQLEGAPVILNLPTDRARPAIQSFRGARQSIELSVELTRELKTLSRKEGVTLYMTLLAAFQTLLHRYTSQDDIVVGSPIANRNRIEIEGLIGFFVNTLVLRTDHSGNPTFRELLHRVRETALEAYAHQDLPFEKLVEELRPDRDLSRSPVFQAMFVLQNAPARELSFEGFTVSPVRVAGETAKFDLTLSLNEGTPGLRGVLQYNTDLFDEATITRMLGHFQTLLEGIVANPEQRIGELPLLTEPEKDQLLVEWNETKADYPKDKCIHELFETQVEKTPDAVALVFEDQKLTYQELNNRANQLAHYLQKLGVGSEVLVGICVERSLEMVIALLGVIKAGGAYVPLDPSNPQERLAFMIKDAGACLVLTEKALLKNLPQSAPRMVCLDEDWPAIAKERENNTECRVTAETLAYVIYTSGSTGTPKGVAVPHRAVNRLVINSDYIQLTPVDVMAQVSNVSFDAATFEIWGALLNGARLALVSKDTLLSPEALSAAIERYGITTLFLTTALFNQVVERIPAALGNLHHLLFGGEAVDARQVRELLRKGPPKRLLHVYGPTESTTFASWYLARNVAADATTVPIGRPIANSELYILDSNRNPVPIGIVGELYIGGAGLARGYLKRPDLTAEKFISHPFSSERGARLYKTGDLARYLPDASIEFLGRMDHQVKIRGFRIELGEIEAVLGGHPGVREALVLVREDAAESHSAAIAADKRLVAYIVAGETAPAVSELRAFVRKTLPDYMVPSAFVFLDALPLTANGKVDRKTLPAPEERHAGGESLRDPRSPTEIALADIWSEVLNLSQVGIDDNFFDLGGHSLLATRLMARIKSGLGTEVPLRILFEGPTIAQLAPKIRSKKQESIFHQREQGNYAHLFELQAGDPCKPIFCFPFRGGLDGEFFNFTRVARHFISQYSFYGVLARGLDGVSEPRYGVQEMAADYVKEIISVQPHGPYIFVGECQGGFVAYEAARQIIADGRKMGLLVLLDTHAGLPAQGFWRRSVVPLKYRVGKSPAWKYFRSRYDYHIQAIRQQKAPAALGYALAKLTGAVSTIPYLIDLERSENFSRGVSNHDRVRLRLDSLRQAFDLAIRRYVLQCYTGRVSLLLNERSFNRNAMRGWADYIATGPEVYKLPGDHDTCVPQNIPLVAQILKDCLAGLEKKA
jgi:amino acid adenylation domain-containing protein